MSNNPLTIGRAMKVGRVEHDLTQEELSQRVRCSRQTIMTIERELVNPGFVLAYRISRALKFSLNDIVPNEPYAEKD